MTREREFELHASAYRKAQRDRETRTVESLRAAIRKLVREKWELEKRITELEQQSENRSEQQ